MATLDSVVKALGDVGAEVDAAIDGRFKCDAEWDTSYDVGLAYVC